MTIIRESDLTDYARTIGIWESLCEQAGVNPERVEELDIITVKEG